MLELEKALSARCAADEQYATLLAQWTFDKQIVGRALNAVPLIFPHYSLHESSHSNTILRQIARVLGPSRIARLDATDLWLILEAAYHHDLGMVVPDDEMRAWWDTEDFETYLDELKTSPDDDLRGAAELLDKKRRYTAGDGAWPFDVRRALVLVMADFARPRHAARSRTYVRDPSRIHLDSPRTPLVPARFWGLLGRICEAHGQSFSQAMMLPPRESGFAIDDAHPRFVACMLRLGDLLDLDDGRFCPVLARAFGRLPQTSLSHKEKHHSITHFLVDATEVRVIAECETPSAFDATEQWFSWLRDELIQQSVHWAGITPEKDFGAMPSPGHIEVRLNGYHTSPDGRRPRFEVDKEAMLDFVKGAGLYSDETACMSELLQNAVDATLVRAWCIEKERWLRLQDNRSASCIVELREALSRLPIEVVVERVVDDGLAADSNYWRVRISDSGTGISTADVRFLQSVGSSRRNPRRKELSRGMPEWMRPSGHFGIGLQSVFLFTDKVVLRSRASDGLDTIEIELSQLSGRPEPQILVKTVTGNEALPQPGTQVFFTLKEPKIPPSYRYNGEDAETRTVVSEYDALLDHEMPVLPSRMRDAARAFARSSFATVRLSGEVVQPSPSETLIQRATGRKASGEVYFDYETGAELKLVACLSGRFDFAFRGRATSEYLSFTLFGGSVDWHTGSAAQLLTINREKFRAGQRGPVEEGVWRAIMNAAEPYYENLKRDAGRTEERQYLTLAAQLYDDLAARLPKDDGSWRSLKYPQTEYELGTLVDAERLEFVEDPGWSANSRGPRDPEVEAIDGGFRVSCNHTQSWMWDLLRSRHIALLDVEEVKTERPGTSWLNWKETWLASRAPGDDTLKDPKLLKYVLDAASKMFLRSARRTIPCPSEYLALALKPDSEPLLTYSSWLFHRLKPRCIFPFRVSGGGTVSLSGAMELIRWTFEHRALEQTTELQVARALMSLVTRAHELMQADWGARADYGPTELARLLRGTYGPDLQV